ncbi:SUMF1/EgtB/PvdO family nonheme iron enzyme [Prosthecobacter sp.]|uniref:SUMF1/EgtB/PvdO family nonheme iron enzyme n=1 Tax=Prosthecobacter sp. TaxID=1965333 RepID=UPI0024872A38|nr:SUMF1/EgtB/PvdO family nonheme iron enzyme [Prosthecobacter sp.]MDI1312691.1 SUMF1/EgtB/PvdO family nonheme iron enzyme [Prosthecobacter sp.]
MALTPALLSAVEKVDFNKQIKPLLEGACTHCHGEKEDKGDFRMHTLEDMKKGNENGPGLTPGDLKKSAIYTTLLLASDEDMAMPPKKEGMLEKSQIEVIKTWIEQGAEWPAGVVLEQTPRIKFEKHIQPILEENCVSCHNAEKAKGDWVITTKKEAFSTGENAPNIIPFDLKSAIYHSTTLAADDDDLMPPKKSGGPLSKENINYLKLWIEQGAPWPDDLKLTAKEKKGPASTNPDNMELVKKIHAFIVQTSKEKTEAEMKAYDSKIPKTGIPFSMVVIKSGEFTMGSPESEADRGDDEGPQVKKTLKPFWMGKFEVTWDEYEPFQLTSIGRNKDGSRQVWKPTDKPEDLISQPTPPYQPMDFGMGRDHLPAICMTQHAANKYCQWLSAQTGQFYRLPTEAEWEYAARAGTKTAYFFGDDKAQLKEYAWYFDNAPNFQYAKVGMKKPNPWGLHDIYGNVCEWCLDQYTPTMPGAAIAGNDWVRSKTPYPHVARGGTYDDDPELLRSSARKASDPLWKQQDPQLPKSIWYLTDATWLGFRIVRPLEIPTVEEMFAAWNNGVAKE